MRFFWACVCVVASLFISGCGPVPGTPPSKPSRPAIYAFSASWCSYCQKDKPRLQEFESQGNVVVRINLDERPDLQKKYNVTSIPEYMVVVQGHIVLRTHNLEDAIQAVQSERSP